MFEDDLDNYFEDYPRIGNCEGPRDGGDEVMRGSISCGYGRSMYNFHFEYPIEGVGVRKDKIVVVESDGTRTSMFDYCRKHGITVRCRHCSEDITTQVSMYCIATSGLTYEEIHEARKKERYE